MKAARFALALVVIALLVSMQAARAAESTLVVLIPSDVANLDPAFCMDNVEWRQTYVAYDRLVQYDGKSTTVKPMLAGSWDISPDGKVYTFRLRRDVKFWDGTPLDASAVKFSFDRVIKMGKGPSEAFAALAEVKALDAYTVQMVLNYPFAPFLSCLATNGGGIVNPKAIQYEKNADLAHDYLSTHLMGSGPYKLKDWARDQHIILEASPDYWGGKPKIGTVVMKIVPEPAAQRMMLLRGEAHIAEGILIDQMDKIRSEKGVTVVEEPSQYCCYVYINTQHKLLDNPKVRQALAYAVDYQGIIKSVLQNYGTQMRGPIPAGMWGHGEAVFQYHRDVAKARQLLAEAGVKNLKVRILYSDRVPTWAQEVMILQANFQDIGVKLEPEMYAYATMRDKIDRGDFDLCMGVWMPDYADPYMFMTYWFDSRNFGLAGNRAFYSNPKVDVLLRRAEASTSQLEREKLYLEAQDIIMEDCPYIFLYQKNYLLPMRSNVKGFVYNSMLTNIYNLQDMWID